MGLSIEQFEYFDGFSTSSGGGLLVQKYQFVIDGDGNAFYLCGAFWPAMVRHTLKLYTCIGVFMFVCISILVAVSGTEVRVVVKASSDITRYAVLRTAQSALHFTPWQTCSFQGHFNFSGKHSVVLGDKAVFHLGGAFWVGKLHISSGLSPTVGEG